VWRVEIPSARYSGLKPTAAVPSMTAATTYSTTGRAPPGPNSKPLTTATGAITAPRSTRSVVLMFLGISLLLVPDGASRATPMTDEGDGGIPGERWDCPRFP
jgi:hypothetical protein